MTPTEFRAQFPEFTVDKYSDQTVGVWITTAGHMMNAGRWASLLPYGTALYVAHHLASKMGLPGGGVASQGGAVASKSVDKVSVGYDTGASTVEGANHWNTTRYGVEYASLARMIGAGGLQI